ncbi:MAG: exodeoxyribonuclease III [Proteobacteria bacterium]|nr:exodeoxyribonuclease III [Pseudomonadota bacterium]
MKKFKVATFNANSIRARLPVIVKWLDKEQPDLLCLQESKVQDKDFPLKPFQDRDLHVAFRGQKAYNGVAMVSKDPLEDLRLDLYDEADEEARFMSAVVRGIPVINVYVPQGFAPGTDKFQTKLRWLEDLLSYLKDHHDPGLPLMVTGDFNVALDSIDVYDPESLRGEVGFHPEEQAVFREYFAWGLVDVFREHVQGGGHYTFWDYRIPNGFKRKMGWRIDYILATPPLAKKSQKAWIDTEPRGAEKPSDHTFLVAEFDLQKLE